MKLNKRIAGVVMGASLLLGSLGSGIAMAQVSPERTSVAPQQEAGPNDQMMEPSYSGSITVPQDQATGQSEADESAALQSLTRITADQAKAAAEAANPGATAVKVGLDNENGVLVYSVELSNGLDVKVDAGNGQILHTEQAGGDREGGAQVGEASEISGVEDAPGQ